MPSARSDGNADSLIHLDRIFNEDIPMLDIPDTSVTELGIPQANGSHNEEARRSARACT